MGISNADFVHLHLHTDYSILDGAIKIPELADYLSSKGFKAAAITDHGNMFGVVNFYESLNERGLKPIIGMEAYVVPNRFDRKPPKSKVVTDENVKVAGYHLVLLAMNEIGYKNLIKLSTRAFLEGFYYKPRIDYQLLEKYNEGLIASTACLAGEIPRAILAGDEEKLKERLDFYLSIFGRDRFFLELQYHGLRDQELVNRKLLEIAKRYKLRTIITNDAHYLRAEDYLAHDILLCIQTGSKLSDEKRFRFETREFYIKDVNELSKFFPHSDFRDSYLNTREIAEMVDFKMSLGERFYLPKYPDLPPGKTSAQYLRELCEENLPKLYPNYDEKVRERLDYELSIIERMGFPDYFLIVWDFINWARSQGIPVGPGRGSVGGSLVAYLLGITRIDPLRYNLLFERFLNPGRKSLPDIDTDFCFERRDEVIEYVRRKYGYDKVAHIGTFGTMKARAAVRDVCRVLGLPVSFADSLAKMIPQNSSIKEALENDEYLRKRYRSDTRVKQVLDLAMKLEGVVRNTSVHAAGVVISVDPLEEIVPLHKAQDTVITQYDMGALEKIGLLKMDFLGLRTLTVIDHALRSIERNRGKKIRMEDIPLDDKRTYQLLSEGRTVGVFQLESLGMRRILVRLKPSCIEDLIALIALYRPGPLQAGLVDKYIEGKHDPSKVQYLHPDLEPILKETYGIILYQEQVMLIASKFAGFTLSEADDLRKAIGKKKKDLMAKYREKFIQGAVKNGYPEELAKELYDIIEKFAGYGFNKSHSTAYAHVSYITAYLKANYPQEFMAALLTSVRNHPDKLKTFLRECRDMGLQVLPPDINKSQVFFEVEGEAIRFGLAGIKNVGEGPAKMIVEARGDKPFESIEDFLSRVPKEVANKRVMESLILAGVFDSLDPDRYSLLSRLDALLKRSRTKSMSLFGNLSTSKPKTVPKRSSISEEELLRLEREYLGIYLSKHPVESLDKELRDALIPISHLRDLNENCKVVFGGVIGAIKVSATKRGRKIVMIVEDDTSEIECFSFDESLVLGESKIEEGDLVLIEGELIPSEDEELPPRVKVERVYKPDELSLDEIKEKNSLAYKLLYSDDYSTSSSIPTSSQDRGGDAQQRIARSPENLSYNLRPLRVWVTVEYPEARIDDLKRLRDTFFNGNGERLGENGSMIPVRLFVFANSENGEELLTEDITGDIPSLYLGEEHITDFLELSRKLRGISAFLEVAFPNS